MRVLNLLANTGEEPLARCDWCKTVLLASKGT